MQESAIDNYEEKISNLNISYNSDDIHFIDLIAEKSELDIEYKGKCSSKTYSSNEKFIAQNDAINKSNEFLDLLQNK